MKYLAITGPTAEWLLSRVEYRKAVCAALPQLSESTGLSRTVLAVGTLRACASHDTRVLALWNADYLSNVGDEPWAVIRLESPYGLLDIDFVEEAFDRELYVCSQRIQGLMLPSSVIHHARDGGIHTCVSGRGEGLKARIAFVESETVGGASSQRSILCHGPTY